MPTSADPVHLRRASTDDLSTEEVAVIRVLLDEAFGDDEEERFEEDDWAHAVGGTHFLAELHGAIVAHAAVVERDVHVDGRPLRTGYVEAVATAPGHQGRGIGTRLMADVTDFIRERFELGALGTGVHRFYERLGWQTWLGPSSVRVDGSERRTRDEDGYILVLATPSSPVLDLSAPISCEWRLGDAW